MHRLIENRGYRFVLTGSSARSLRRVGVNLLGGRALTFRMYPLTAVNCFEILEDLLLSFTIPVFARRAKRRLVTRRTFYLFDSGVFRTIRPAGRPIVRRSTRRSRGISSGAFGSLVTWKRVKEK